jgi:hypothetical protein
LAAKVIQKSKSFYPLPLIFCKKNSKKHRILNLDEEEEIYMVLGKKYSVTCIALNLFFW